jgi:hypothetical protein
MRRKALMLLTITLFSMLGIVGCEEKKGPLEKAGEEIDEGVNDAKRKIEDATD